MAFFQVKNITRTYEGKGVIKNVNIGIEKGEIVSLLGESGVGKTTLFNVMSGLEIPQEGHVYLNKTKITGISGKISYMQQKDLLLPFLKILDNITMPMKLKGIAKDKAYEEARKYLGEFGLQGTENQYPCQLSGGMKQRASFLRSYFYSKEMMLLDEPFSALDSITKSNMHQWFHSVAKKHEITAFFITHDIAEAIFLSDRIYIMKGKPGEIRAEFNIEYAKERDEEFILSNEFLEYQRAIKRILV